MEDPRKQLLEKLKSANNILVSVSRNPSVDQLAACLGLTLALNRLGKHGTAVFSGEVPSTIEFLQPEDTIEKNTDSLRDFIIALDKSKADKLRYKVEDDVVRIFITPYRTSISDADLEFSQGDFNVDVVVALGVARQEDLDEAIVAHGRILHDATVTSINVAPDGGLGSINWHDPQASSLSELVTEVVQGLGTDLIDGQIATALLTGIVAETARFSNEKTTPQTMSLSALLMSAGANQQLIATKLDEPAAVAEASEDSNQSDHDGEDDDAPDQQSQSDNGGEPPQPPQQDGTLAIDHDSDQSPPPFEPAPAPQAAQPSDAEQSAQPELELPSLTPDRLSAGPRLITEPPTLGGRLTANSEPEALDPSTDPMGQVQSSGQLLNHDAPAAAPPEPLQAPEPFIPGMTPPPPAWVPPSDDPFNMNSANPTVPSSDETLTQIEQEVGSPHLGVLDNQPATEQGLDAARDEVLRALNDSELGALPPVEALNSTPFGGDLRASDGGGVDNVPASSSFDPTGVATATQQPPAGPIEQQLPAAAEQNQASHEFPDDLAAQIPTLPTPPSIPALSNQPTQAPQVIDPNAPPPVPPPIPFQFGGPGAPRPAA